MRNRAIPAFTSAPLKGIALIAVFLLSAGPGFCGEGEGKDRSIFALPFAFYSSDTGFGYGGGGILSYASPVRRPSYVMASFINTTKHQAQAAAKLMHYFPGNRTRIGGEIQYNRFPQEFYGLGNDTSGKKSSTYTPEYALFESSIDRELRSGFMMRTLVFFRNQALVDRGFTGNDIPVVAPWIAGRMDCGAGFGLLRDTRDNTLATRSGSLLQIEYRGSLLRDRGHAFNSLTFQARVFRTVSTGWTVASMLLCQDARGDVPFYLLPNLGGMDRLRGFEAGRFTDRSALLVQEDIRFPILWRIGGCLFGSAGRVAASRADLLSGGLHSSCGAGLRFFIDRDKGMVARFDIAFGGHSRGAYFVMGEAF
jgi:hypothetical protein